MLGLLPKPAVLLATVARSTFVCVTVLSGLFLIALAVRQAAQMIHAALDRHQLPHLLLGLAVVGVKGFFFFPSVHSGTFECVHFGELGPTQKLTQRGLGRPAVGKLGLMCGKIFLAVPGRL